MIYLRQLDILVELIELCQEMLIDLRHQLNYYRASVYKSEAISVIESKLESLAIILGILGEEELSAILSEYYGTQSQISAHLPPGESSISFRLSLLINGIEHAILDFYNQITSKSLERKSDQPLVESIRDSRSLLLSLCKKDSKQYHFFEGICDVRT